GCHPSTVAGALVPRLAFASSFWESYNVLEKPVKAGVRKAMARFQRLSVAELHADKGLHLESVHNARDPRMRTIRINDLYRRSCWRPTTAATPFCCSTSCRTTRPTRGRPSISIP